MNSFVEGDCFHLLADNVVLEDGKVEGEGSTGSLILAISHERDLT